MIFAPNHHSHLDTALMVRAVPPRWRPHLVTAAAADYFFDKRWKATLAAITLNAIPVDREVTNRRSADLMAGLIEDGWSLVIYPEGGRSPDGWGQTFKGGAAYLAGRTGAPVVPVFIDGTDSIMGKGTSVPKPGRTRVTFGSPLLRQPDESTRRFNERIAQAVAALADESTTDYLVGDGDAPPRDRPHRSAARRTPVGDAGGISPIVADEASPAGATHRSGAGRTSAEGANPAPALSRGSSSAGQAATGAPAGRRRSTAPARRSDGRRRNHRRRHGDRACLVRRASVRASSDTERIPDGAQCVVVTARDEDVGTDDERAVPRRAGVGFVELIDGDIETLGDEGRDVTLLDRVRALTRSIGTARIVRILGLGGLFLFVLRVRRVLGVLLVSSSSSSGSGTWAPGGMLMTMSGWSMWATPSSHWLKLAIDSGGMP